MPGEHEESKRLLKENLEVTKQNHVLLVKMHRTHVWELWLKVIWFAVIIGAPIITFYFFVEPYMRALGISTTQIEMLIRKFTHFL